MAAPLRFYLDENVPLAIAVQLRRRGIEAVTVRDLHLLGDSDLNHLQRASTPSGASEPVMMSIARG